jgi:hypothetical protein
MVIGILFAVVLILFGISYDIEPGYFTLRRAGIFGHQLGEYSSRAIVICQTFRDFAVRRARAFSHFPRGYSF